MISPTPKTPFPAPRATETRDWGSARPVAGPAAESAPARQADDGVGATPERLGVYRLVRELGRGGMGVVYEAEHELLGRRVALKTLAPGSHRPGRRERFLREARTAGALRHPNVVAVHDAGADGPWVWVVMDLIEGEALDARLARGPLDAREALAAAFAVARALAHAHAQRIVHRDVKPGNVLLGRDGRVLLADFGLARDLLGPDETTAAGRTLGTPGYMAPEQLRGDDAGTAADVFGLGVTLYEALTGAAPWTGASLGDLRRAMSAPPAPPSTRAPALRGELGPGLAREVDAFVLRCLASDPAARPADGGAAAAALAPLVAASARRARLAQSSARWAAVRAPGGWGGRDRVGRTGALLVLLAGLVSAASAVAGLAPLLAPRLGGALRRAPAPAAPRGAPRPDARPSAAGADAAGALGRAGPDAPGASLGERLARGRVLRAEAEVARRPEDVEARVARALALRDLGRARAAASEAGPEDPEARALARVAADDLTWAAARAGAAPGCALAPDRLLLLLGEVLEDDLGDRAAAREVHARLAARDPGPLGDVARARLAAAARPREALSLVERALAALPGLLPARRLQRALRGHVST